MTETKITAGVPEVPLSETLSFSKNVLALLAGGILHHGCQFAVSIVAARYWGVAIFGEITLALSVISFLFIVQDPGFSVAAIREVARRRSTLPDYLGAIVLLQLATSAVSFMVALLIPVLLGWDSRLTWLLVLYASQFFLLIWNRQWVFRSVERMELVILMQAANGVTNLLALLVLLLVSQDVLVLPMANLVAVAASAATTQIVIRRIFGRYRLKWDPTLWTRIARMSLPLGFSSMMAALCMQSSVFLLALMASAVELGTFSAAHRVILVLVGVQAAFYGAIGPVLARSTEGAAFGQTLDRFLKVMALTGIPIGLGGLAVAPALLVALFGPAYASSGSILQILLLGMAIKWVAGVFGSCLIAQRRTRAYTALEVGTAVATVGLTVPAVAYAGALGAAYAMLVSQLVYGFVAYSFARDLVAVPVQRQLVRIGLIAAASFLWLALFDGPALGVAAVVATVLYALLIVALRLIEPPSAGKQERAA